VFPFLTQQIPPMVCVSKMSRDDCMTVIRNLNQERRVMEGMTLAELRDLIKEMIGDTKAAKQTSPLYQLAEKSKGELKARAESLNIPLTGNEVKANLMRKIRETTAAMTIPTGEELMEFGKYREETMSAVQQKYPDYVQWAITMVSEEGAGCNFRLRQFVAYCLGIAHGEKPFGGIKQETKVKIEKKEPKPEPEETKSACRMTSSASARMAVPGRKMVKEEQMEDTVSAVKKEEKNAMNGALQLVMTRLTHMEIFLGQQMRASGSEASYQMPDASQRERQ
jgi:hypothetical protein